MLLSTSIENYLEHEKHFLGCFPCNMFPPFPQQFPKAMIINTDEFSKPGDHWLGIVLTKKKCYYFDYFGRPSRPVFNQIYSRISS